MILANIFTDLTDWLEDVSGETWFLFVILGIAFFDSIIPVVPSETTVILGGVAAGAGDQNLAPRDPRRRRRRVPRRQRGVHDRRPVRAVLRPPGRATTEDRRPARRGRANRSAAAAACC